MVFLGGAWFFSFFRYNEIRSMSKRYASYWNAFLFSEVSQNLIGLQRFYEFDGNFGDTTSTLKVPLLPVVCC